jgi:drug/metabolite transporter (DMT)-like permease
MIQLEIPRPTETKSNLSALFALCIALLAVSLAPIFIRFSETELGANATVFNRLFIFVVIFGAYQGISHRFSSFQETRHTEKIAKEQWLLLFAVGIISITTLGLWAISLKYTTVAKSMLLNNLTPVFTTLGGWLFLNKRFDQKFLVGMVIALCGALALGLEDLNNLEGNLVGDMYALLSAVFLGAYFLVVEQLRNRFSATTILLWRCAIGSVLLVPIVLITEGQLFPTSPTAWCAVIGLGIISEGFGQRLLADCLDKLSSGFISVFLLLEPLVSAMLAWLLFAENLSPTTWLGFVVIFIGIYLAQSSNAALRIGLQEANIELATPHQDINL